MQTGSFTSLLYKQTQHGKISYVYNNFHCVVILFVIAQT